jgi:hypothetical protein
MAKVEEGDVSEVDASVVDGPVELISKLVFIFAKYNFVFFIILLIYLNLESNQVELNDTICNANFLSK